MLIEKLKKFLPDKEAIAHNKFMHIFGNLIYNPYLWHLTNTSVARSCAIGLFFMWIPIPFHTLLAAGLAIMLNANLPIAIALVWLNNPFTIPPLFYCAYKVGAWALSIPVAEHHTVLHFSLTVLLSSLKVIWKPFVLGCLICASISSLLSYILVLAFWRYHKSDNRYN